MTKPELKKYAKLAIRILFYGGVVLLVVCSIIYERIYDENMKKGIIDCEQSMKAVTQDKRAYIQDTPEKYYQEGIKARSDQVYADANRLFNLAVAGYVKRGDDYYLHSAFDKAAEAYSQALAIRPQDVDINFDLARAQSDAKQYQAESRTLDNIWEIQTMGSKMAPYYYYRAETLVAEGKHNDALEQIDNAVVADGSHAEYYRLKIDILTKLGRLREVEVVKKELADLEK